MKNFVKFVILVCLPLLTAAKTPESVPEYNVGKTVVDKTLKKNESVFDLIFYASGTPIKGRKIKLSDNGKESTVTCSTNGSYSLKVKPGKHKFQFFYNEDHFEIYTDSISIKGGFRTPVHVYFSSSRTPIMAEKPVIYVYSQKETEVNIKLEPKGAFNFTYPAYNKGWTFKTTSTGDINMNNTTYPYLFWDGPLNVNTNDIIIREGFHVSKENLLSFLENKLEMMNLNAREKTDFITYWYPIMSKHEAFYIHFMFNEEYSKYAPLSVDPKPDNLFRVFMLWEAVDKNAEITKLTEQKIPALKRNGLTLIEWGGGEINNMKEQSK